MKLLALLLFGIVLTGSYPSSYQRIVEKYDFLYRQDIPVIITSIPGDLNNAKNCNSSLKVVYGCTYVKENLEPYIIAISSTLPNWKFEWVLLHEIGHFLLKTGDEKVANSYADNMIMWRNSLN